VVEVSLVVVEVSLVVVEVSLVVVEVSLVVVPSWRVVVETRRGLVRRDKFTLDRRDQRGQDAMICWAVHPPAGGGCHAVFIASW
jgi:hypothetical protein